MARNCPTRTPNDSSSSTKTTGTWPDGRPKYYCPYHKKEVAHHPDECKFKGQPSHSHRSSTTVEQVTDVLIRALPQFKESVIKATVPSGVEVIFRRDTTHDDVKKLQAALPEVRIAYPVDTRIIVACSCPTTRQAIQDQLKNAVDAGKPIQTKQFTNATSTTGPLDFSRPTTPGIVFGAAPAAAAQQNTQPTTPISPPPLEGDVPMAPSMDDSVRTEFNRIDGEIAGIRNDISGLNSKIDGFGSQLAEAMKKPVLAAQRPKDASCPDVVPQSYVWTVTRRSTFEKWQPLKTMVTAVADGTFRGLAWSAEGIPLTDWTIEAPFQCAMSEDTARNVAAQ